jgi:hypothetical protein
MSDIAPRLTESAPRQPWQAEGAMPHWLVWVRFAGWILLLAGTFHILQGLVALFRDKVYAVNRSELAIDVDYSVWGWAHLLLGVLVVVTGVALLVGRSAARPVALVLAYLSAIVNVGFLAAFPAWAVIMIALDVLVIYALTVYGHEIGKH